MIRKSNGDRRKGTILPLAAVSLVSVCGFVALAFDIGLIAVAKTQCQNGADAASMAGARSLDGSSTQNIGSSTPPYQFGTAYYYANYYAQNNLIINSPPSSVQIQFGAWHYDTSQKLFIPNFPPVSPDNYNLCQVTVSYNVQTVFAQAFGLLNPNFNSVQTVTAVAQAAHRPRDVCIILDFSGSMNNESDLWNAESYLGNGLINFTSGYTWPQSSNAQYTSNNVDSVYPLFGHYAGSTATAQSTSGNDYSHYDTCPNLLCPAAVSGTPLNGNTEIGKSNIATDLTASNTGIPSAYQAFNIPAVVKDFYSNNRGASANSAFTSAGDGNATTHLVAGDKPLFAKNSSTTYAATVADIIGGTSPLTDLAKWELGGYDAYYPNGTNFQGFTVGPRYWGKTFFIWPPDPRSGKDWRKLYTLQSGGTAWGTSQFDNTKLFVNGSVNGSGIGYNDPAGNYQINYKAILAWITSTSGPGNVNPFPSQLRSGNVLFYDSIPTDVPASAYDHTQDNSAITDPNQRFWKEYIDYVLGVWRAPTGAIQHTQQPSCSIGPDFMYAPGTTNQGTPGTVTSPPTTAVSVPGVGSITPYMNYTDNPWRPRHRFWFGPMTMVQFMSDCGYLSGATHDISMYPMKQGVGGALLDIQNNHPNDLVSLLLFSRPQFNDDSLGTGAFNGPQYNLNNNYSAMVQSMWIPPNSGTNDIRLWTPDGNNIPRAHGDYDANTTSDYGFMLAYNQFSGDSTDLVDSNGKAVGGLGRKGATRLVIYETDGMANQATNPVGGFVNNGSYNSFYAIRPGTDTINQLGYSDNELIQVVMAICNKDDGTPYYSYPSGYPTPPSYPGYATANKPVIVQCIAFGAIFEVPSGTQNSAVNLLTEISTVGGTVFPSSSTDPANGFKWCIGTLQQRQDKLKQAFLSFLDSSVPVSLIQ
jgi:hypothetical protein